MTVQAPTNRAIAHVCSCMFKTMLYLTMGHKSIFLHCFSYFVRLTNLLQVSWCHPFRNNCSYCSYGYVRMCCCFDIFQYPHHSLYCSILQTPNTISLTLLILLKTSKCIAFLNGFISKSKTACKVVIG